MRVWIVLTALLLSCGGPEEEHLAPDDEQHQAPEVGQGVSGLIEHTEDWDWIGFHTRTNDPAFNLFPAGDPRNSVTAANAVATIGTCTAFLITQDLLMTADHCFRNANGFLPGRISTTATFFPETSPISFSCSGPIHNDPIADVITLRCSRNAAGQLPGDIVTPVRVSRTRPVHGTDLFAITHNCRCDDWESGCDGWGAASVSYRLSPSLVLDPFTLQWRPPTCAGSPAGNGRKYRLLSPGGLGQTYDSRFRNCEVNNDNSTWDIGLPGRRGFNHNCDTLEGSSGGPVFGRISGSVVGIVSAHRHAFGSYNMSGEVWRWMQQADRNANGTLERVEATHKFSWLPWHSDEDAPDFANCPAGYAMSGFECKGHYCDDVRPLCQPVPGGTNSPRRTFVQFSEEQPGLHGCASNEVAIGIACTGSNCDNLEFRCARVNGTVVASSCTTSAFFSEENGPFVNLGNRFIRRAECRGSYCDDVRFELCTVNFSASCVGSCGIQAPSGCWCDTQCDSMADCCPDVGLMCR